MKTKYYLYALFIILMILTSIVGYLLGTHIRNYSLIISITGVVSLVLYVKYNKKLLLYMMIIIILSSLGIFYSLYYFLHPKIDKTFLVSSSRNKIKINSYYVNGGATTDNVVWICKSYKGKEIIIGTYSGFNSVKSIDWLNDSTAQVVLSKNFKDSLLVLKIE